MTVTATVSVSGCYIKSAAGAVRLSLQQLFEVTMAHFLQQGASSGEGRAE